MQNSTFDTEKICRTIDAILIGYAKQNLSCFLADLDLTMDVVRTHSVIQQMQSYCLDESLFHASYRYMHYSVIQQIQR
jgi:hypothetical protein